MNWHDLFKGYILERGYEYYKKGAVEDIYKRENLISATVEGSEDYEVTIELKNGEPEYMYCSCPYADEGKNCKHMAAVLFEWEFSGNDSDETPSENIEELVKKVDRNIIDSFLVKKLSENEELLAEFKITVDQVVSKEDIVRYKRMIDNIIDNYACDGYVSYRDAYDFACEIQNFIHSYIDVMTDKNCFKEASELVGYLYNSVAELEMDSSEGEMDIIVIACMEVWKEITDNADITLKKQIFNTFIDIIDKNRNYYFTGEAEDFLVENFTEYDFLEKELLIVIKKIHNAERNHSYMTEKWHLQALKIYSNMGKDIDFIENYCNDHKSFAGVRRYYVDKCLEYNEYDKAIATLKESIKLDKEYPSIVESHMRTLKNIYKDLGEKEKYRDILWDMVTRNSIGDIDCYKELKLLYDEEQWKVKREKIFSSLKESNYLGEIYAEEKLYDKLLKYAVNRQDIYEIQKYKEMLMDKFPKEVLNKYGRELDKMAAEVSSRKYYKKIAVILTSLLEIKGGKDYVKNKIEEYKLAYPRRKAMIEELNYVPVNG